MTRRPSTDTTGALRWRGAALLLLAGLCAGCAGLTGASAAADDPLPFHVAVVGWVTVLPEDPAGGAVGGTPAAGIDATASSPATDVRPAMRLEADGQMLTSAVARELTRRAFTRATAIVPPRGSARGFTQELRRAARDAGAELLLLCELEYRRPITFERTSPVLLNLGLFVLGGPSIWVIDEYTYYAQAELQVRLYDLVGAQAATAGPGDQGSPILSAQVEFSGVETDFIDRVEAEAVDRVWNYLASLLSSTFVVAQEGPGIAAMVSRRALSALGEQLAEELLARRDDVLAGASSASRTQVSLARLHPHYDGSNRFALVGDVELLPGGELQRLTTCRVEIAGRVLDFPLGEGLPGKSGDGAGRRYHIRLTVPDVDPDVRTWHLVLRGGEPPRVLRSFTFAVPRLDS